MPSPASLVAGHSAWRSSRHPATLLAVLLALSHIVGPQAAPDARAGDIVFEAAAAELGLGRDHASTCAYGPGIAVVDFDGDGDLDLFLTNDIAGNQLWSNEPRGPRDIAPELGLDHLSVLPPFGERVNPSSIEVGSMMPSLLDLDRDGDLDLFLTAWNSYNQLWRNDGAAGFTNISESSPLRYVGQSATGAFGDMDLDGDLDVFVADWGGPDHLFRNQGGLVFKDISEASGLRGVAIVELPSWSALWYRHDGDAHPELYVGIDFGFPNQLFRNLGGVGLHEASRDWFPEISDSTVDPANATMGQALGDFDRDGDMDLFVANTGENNLYQRQGSQYVDLMKGKGGFRSAYTDVRIGWGCDWADLDNDGWVDLALVNGFIPLCEAGTPGYPLECGQGGVLQQPNRLWRNLEGTAASDLSVSSGFGQSHWGRALAVADFDLDGDLDAFHTNNDGGHQYWRNETADTGQWLQVRLQGTTSNPEAIGAEVTAHAGGVPHLRWRLHSQGYLAQNADVLHFGLGEAREVERLVVRWPNGLVEEWTGIPAGQRVRLVEGAAAARGGILPAPPELSLRQEGEAVAVAWEADPTEAWDHFVILRDRDGAWASTVATLAADRPSMQWFDPEVEVGVQYHYRVVGVVGGLEAMSPRQGHFVEGATVGPLPSRPELSANFPNPFNPATRWSVRLPAGGPHAFELGLYDSRGRKLRTLRRGASAQGEFEVEWDGRDGGGRALPSGSYLARLSVAGHPDATRKLALLR